MAESGILEIATCTRRRLFVSLRPRFLHFTPPGMSYFDELGLRFDDPLIHFDEIPAPISKSSTRKTNPMFDVVLDHQPRKPLRLSPKQPGAVEFVSSIP